MSAYIRTLTSADVEAVTAIERASFPAPWSEELFRCELGRTDRIWLVAAQKRAVLGYVGAALVGDEAHILNLAVEPTYRRRGLASALMRAIYERLIAEGVVRVTLEVRTSNAGAISLYESADLTRAGVRPKYYPETGEDAVIMWSGDLTAGSSQQRLESLSAKGAEALRMFGGPEDLPRPLVLAIETSCDETAAALMAAGETVLADVVASQTEFHHRFGGVVPEIASRKHTEAIVSVVDEAMARAREAAGRPLGFGDLDAIAVTYGPGLVGALVVGVAYAKGLAMASGVPLVGVNHLEGHMFAAAMGDSAAEPPFVALIVSGGHTSLTHVPRWGAYRTLGETLDDAVGEAFDKVAKLLGLGYPGGPVISRLAEEGDPNAIPFPRAMLHSGDLAFSLSGLKTAVINHVRVEEAAGRAIDVHDLAASFQAAVIDVQVAKALSAVRECGVDRFVLGGGVAANRALREALDTAMRREGVSVHVPSLDLCTDNAVMIAAAGTFRFLEGDRLGLDAEADPGLRLG